MKFAETLLLFFALATTIHALAFPATFASAPDLFKRKGGGGGRGGGRGSGSSSSSSKGGSTSSSSNRGGYTSAGSGTPRTYGNGGAYYPGGATVPYAAGQPSGSVAPYLLSGAVLGGGLGLAAGAWSYHFPGPYTWHNDTTNRTQSGPLNCLCAQYSSCACAANPDQTYLDSVANNQSIASVAANGTLTVNGTLANGTTAPGGSDSGAGVPIGKEMIWKSAGWWILVAGVGYAVATL